MNFKNTYKALNEASKDGDAAFANPDDISRDHTNLWFSYKKVVGIQIVISDRNMAVSSVSAFFQTDEELDRQDFIHDFLFRVIGSSKTVELKLVDNKGKKVDLETVAKKYKNGVKEEYGVLTKDGKKVYHITINSCVLDSSDNDLYHG